MLTCFICETKFQFASKRNMYGCDLCTHTHTHTHTFFTRICVCVHKYKYNTPNIVIFSFTKILDNCSWSVIERSLVKMFKLVFMLIVLACTVLFMQATEITYSSKYDDIDIDAILTNSRLREQYFNCVLNRSPCTTAAGRFFKDHFADAIVTKCRRCTDKQIVILDKIFSWYTQNEPEKFRKAVEIVINNYKNKKQ